MRFSTICKGEQLFAPPKYGVFFGLVQTPDKTKRSTIDAGQARCLAIAVRNRAIAMNYGESLLLGHHHQHTGDRGVC